LHGLQPYGEVEVQLHSLLNSALVKGVNFMLQPLYSRENRLQYPLNTTLELVWIFWVDEISCLYIESHHDSSVFHPVGKSLYWLYSAGYIASLLGNAYCWCALCFIYIYILV